MTQHGPCMLAQLIGRIFVVIVSSYIYIFVVLFVFVQTIVIDCLKQ